MVKRVKFITVYINFLKSGVSKCQKAINRLKKQNG